MYQTCSSNWEDYKYLHSRFIEEPSQKGHLLDQEVDAKVTLRSDRF